MSIAKWSEWRRTIALKAAASLKTLILNHTQRRCGFTQHVVSELYTDLSFKITLLMYENVADPGIIRDAPVGANCNNIMIHS